MANNLTVADIGTLVAETKAEITGQNTEDKVAQLIQNPALLNRLIAAYEDSLSSSKKEPEKRKEFETLLYSHGLDQDILSRACDKVYSYQDAGE